MPKKHVENKKEADMDIEEKASLVNGTFSYTRTDKIRILNIVNEQMRAMIKVYGDNPTDPDELQLIEILEDEIRKNELKIEKIRRREPLKLNYFQRWNDEEDI